MAKSGGGYSPIVPPMDTTNVTTASADVQPEPAPPESCDTSGEQPQPPNHTTEQQDGHY